MDFLCSLTEFFFWVAQSVVKSMEKLIVEKMQPLIMSHVDVIVAKTNIYRLQTHESLIAYIVQDLCLHFIWKNESVLPRKTVQFCGHVVAVSLWQRKSIFPSSIHL